MAVTFENNWLYVIERLRALLRTEFSSSLPVYIGHNNKNVSSQYLRLDPNNSSLLEYASFSETREFNINILYYSSVKDIEKPALDNAMRIVSRIEALIHDNITMTLPDTNSTTIHDCKIESSEFDTEEEEDKYVVTMSFNCKHIGNVA